MKIHTNQSQGAFSKLGFLSCQHVSVRWSELKSSHHSQVQGCDASKWRFLCEIENRLKKFVYSSGYSKLPQHGRSAKTPRAWVASQGSKQLPLQLWSPKILKTSTAPPGSIEELADKAQFAEGCHDPGVTRQLPKQKLSEPKEEKSRVSGKVHVCCLVEPLYFLLIKKIVEKKVSACGSFMNLRTVGRKFGVTSSPVHFFQTHLDWFKLGTWKMVNGLR